MPLSEGSAPRIKPAIHDVGLAHHLTRTIASWTIELDVVDVWSMQLGRHRRVRCLHFLHLSDAADAVLYSTIRADPNRNRCAPISLAADCPILDVGQPLSHTLLTSPIRSPFDLRIVLHDLLLDGSHSHEPTVHGVVQQWVIRAPAMWVIVSVNMLSIQRILVCK